RWTSCNILQIAPDGRRLWQFDAKGGGFVLAREHKGAEGAPMPGRAGEKSWSHLWQPKLNVAWLPPEEVFLRVIELPKSNYDETRAMVELQLEKLSPLPVTQIVWTLHLLPPPPVKNETAEAAAAELQYVVVVIASRAVVESYLGKLEGTRFIPDRLETPLLDQLEMSPPTEDGAWIYAGARGKDSALVAWWFGGALRNLSFIVLSPDTDRIEGLKRQLAQLFWSGEIEGWLAGKPAWHLVADPVAAADWEAWLRAALGEPVRVTHPSPAAELAARTAARAAAAPEGAALLPQEFAARYHQEFVDRLWLRGLVATGILYAIGVVIYFGATDWLARKTTAVQQQVARISQSYTNVLQLQARYQVLKQRQLLEYAALDCWKIVAEDLPAGLTLQRFSFSGGEKLSLSGICSPDQISLISDPGKFYDAVRKAKMNDREMFEPEAVEPLIWNESGNVVSWRFTLQLRQEMGGGK
ncbi:MAG TPA: hypothetical protein VL970_06135, partial [Candidatus Acidoferrales bacterium]|nr:hypothetical protein [Candidatus Acidoferrales bacterium]